LDRGQAMPHGRAPTGAWPGRFEGVVPRFGRSGARREREAAPRRRSVRRL